MSPRKGPSDPAVYRLIRSIPRNAYSAHKANCSIMGTRYIALCNMGGGKWESDMPARRPKSKRTFRSSSAWRLTANEQRVTISGWASKYQLCAETTRRQKGPPRKISLKGGPKAPSGSRSAISYSIAETKVRRIADCAPPPIYTNGYPVRLTEIVTI